MPQLLRIGYNVNLLEPLLSQRKRDGKQWLSLFQIGLEEPKRSAGLASLDWLEKIKLARSFTCLETTIDVHFLIDILEMGFYGIDRNHQHLCYLLSGVSLGQQAKHLKFL